MHQRGVLEVRDEGAACLDASIRHTASLFTVETLPAFVVELFVDSLHSLHVRAYRSDTALNTALNQQHASNTHTAPAEAQGTRKVQEGEHTSVEAMLMKA
jgi:hypothetical protein